MILYKVRCYVDGYKLLNLEAIAEITPGGESPAYDHIREQHNLDPEYRFWEVALINKNCLLLDDDTVQIILKEKQIKIKDLTDGKIRSDRGKHTNNWSVGQG